MNRPTWHPVAVARDPPGQLVATPRSSWPECPVASAAAAIGHDRDTAEARAGFDPKQGRVVRQFLGIGNQRLDAAERRPVLDDHPPLARDGHVHAAQARREVEVGPSRIERRLAEVEVDAAEDDAHRPAP